MSRFQNNFILLCFICIPAQNLLAINATENFKIVVPEEIKSKEVLQYNQNKTIQKLVQDQTDIIKKIISSEKDKRTEYPIITKQQQKAHNEPEKLFNDELYVKCQHLKDSISRQNESTMEGSDRTSSVQLSDLQKKPEQQIPTPESSQTHNTQNSFNVKPLNYFFITRNQTPPNSNNQLFPAQHSVSSHKNNLELNSNSLKSFTNSNGNQNPVPINNNQYQSNIKYVQSQPVILQKMVLNDGKELFYWYQNPVLQSHNVPSIKQQPQPPIYTTLYSTQTQASTTQRTNTEAAISIPSSPVQLTHNQILQETQSPPKPATLQQQNMPNYEIQYETAQKDNSHIKQMKFIIPIQYGSSNGMEIVKRHPWDFDPYAYYPRALQPVAVRLPMPYVPMFHMIRTLTVPEASLKSSNIKNL